MWADFWLVVEGGGRPWLWAEGCPPGTFQEWQRRKRPWPSPALSAVSKKSLLREPHRGVRLLDIEMKC